MSFKEDLAEDIRDTFLAEDEFAETHCIDGAEIPAAVIKKSHGRRRHNIRSYEDGIYDKQVVVFVAGSVFGELPAVRRPVMLDGRRYLVKAADNECGMYRIILEVT